jgi:hypothetical protein
MAKFTLNDMEKFAERAWGELGLNAVRKWVGSSAEFMLDEISMHVIGMPLFHLSSDWPSHNSDASAGEGVPLHFISVSSRNCRAPRGDLSVARLALHRLGPMRG